jgi:protein CWC15
MACLLLQILICEFFVSGSEKTVDAVCVFWVGWKMTTAHRPTWKPAVGGVKNHGFVSQQTSAKDQVGMTTLKFRQIGQSNPEEMERRSFLDELEKREYEQLSEKNKAILQIESEEKKVDSIALLKNHAEVVTATGSSSKFDDSDADFDDRDNEFDSSR